jgi:hypothetical protein
MRAGSLPLGVSGIYRQGGVAPDRGRSHVTGLDEDVGRMVALLE